MGMKIDLEGRVAFITGDGDLSVARPRHPDQLPSGLHREPLQPL